MNNLNNQNKFPQLEAWCKRYYETVGLKVHPANVPTDAVFDEILENIAAIDHRQDVIKTVLETMMERFVAIEDKAEALKKFGDNLLTIYDTANYRITALEELTLKINEGILKTNESLAESNGLIQSMINSKKVKK